MVVYCCASAAPLQQRLNGACRGETSLGRVLTSCGYETSGRTYQHRAMGHLVGPAGAFEQKVTVLNFPPVQPPNTGTVLLHILNEIHAVRHDVPEGQQRNMRQGFLVDGFALCPEIVHDLGDLEGIPV